MIVRKRESRVAVADEPVVADRVERARDIDSLKSTANHEVAGNGAERVGAAEHDPICTERHKHTAFVCTDHGEAFARFAELDAGRRDRVMAVAYAVDQVVITTPDEDRPGRDALPEARRHDLQGGVLAPA